MSTLWVQTTTGDDSDSGERHSWDHFQQLDGQLERWQPIKIYLMWVSTGRDIHYVTQSA